MRCLDLQFAVARSRADALEQAARRRAGGAFAVLVIDAAVAGAHEQARLREPLTGQPRWAQLTAKTRNCGLRLVGLPLVRPW